MGCVAISSHARKEKRGFPFLSTRLALSFHKIRLHSGKLLRKSCGFSKSFPLICTIFARAARVGLRMAVPRARSLYIRANNLLNGRRNDTQIRFSDNRLGRGGHELCLAGGCLGQRESGPCVQDDDGGGQHDQGAGGRGFGDEPRSGQFRQAHSRHNHCGRLHQRPGGRATGGDGCARGHQEPAEMGRAVRQERAGQLRLAPRGRPLGVSHPAPRRRYGL